MFPTTQLPDSAKRVLISVNPSAGARHRQDLIERLEQELAEQELEPTRIESLEQLQSLTADPTVGPEIRAVIAGGGDGTVGLLANLTPPGTPLAILPLGTENLLAKYLQITAEPKQLAQLVAEGCTIQMDAGRANGRLFLLMAGIGFDAEVVRRMHDLRRGGHISHLSYAKPIFETIRNYQYPQLSVYCESEAGETLEHSARWAFVVNVPRYARGLAILPGARPDDGVLDVCTFKEGSLMYGLVYLGGIVLGQHHTWEHCTTQTAQRVRITSTEPVPYQLDGDPGGFLPVEIEILPRRLTLVVSRDWAEREPR